MKGFEKDMLICLKPGHLREDGCGDTHAYFPGLMNCLSTLEYLGRLYCGSTRKGVADDAIRAYAGRFMSDYSVDDIRTLVEAFRNPIAHRGDRLWCLGRQAQPAAGFAGAACHLEHQ